MISLRLVLPKPFENKTIYCIFTLKTIFMKRILFSFSLITSLFAGAQDCAKIFISEYVEGWSNNKALEIYNPTSTAVNLSDYFVARYSNGSTTATVANSVQLSGTIAPYDVFVAVLDKRDPNGTGQEAPIWDSLNARGDGFFSAVYNTSSAFYWNGNDAVMLAKGTLPANPTTLINASNVPNFAIIDIFGKIGENPANETGSAAGNDGAWSTGFPYSTGIGVLVTKDHSMIRKGSIKKGITTPVSFFDPLLEWDTIPPVTYLFDENGDTVVSVNGNAILFGNWFSLGEHDCACNPASINETKEDAISIYPNPSQGIFYIKSEGNIQSVRVLNAFGQTVANFSNLNNKLVHQLDLSSQTGLFLLQITNNKGERITRKVILK